jgi:hypothetical protein
MLLGYLYLYVIRLLGGVIIWLSFALSLLIIAASGFYTYFYARNEYDPLNPTYRYLEIASYVLWGIAGALLVLILCCVNAIKIGVAVFKTTAKYIQSNLTIFVLPAVSSAVILAWLCYWIIAAIFIFSVGTPEPRENYPFVTEVKWDTNTRLVFIYHVFGLLWINAFVIGCAQFIVGASACIWYFECNTDSKGLNTMGRAARWLFRYHLGSIAFGSFVIAVC